MSGCMNYHGNHAVVLFPGTAAAKEGNEENDHTDSNEDDGGSGSWCIIDHEGPMQSDLNHDANDNQC